MDFGELREFLSSRMKLSHIYQPLLIKTLVESGGSATIRQLAVAFLAYDESEILYYEKRLKEMPIRVLKNHGVISRSQNLITLNVEKLTLEQKSEIRKICEAKIHDYIASRGLAIWDYRLLDDNPIPDSLRFRILKEAKGRCALCGATKDERPLDIDHIKPRSQGGKTEYENLQVLCSKCNRSKRDEDSTDFRGLIEREMDHRCPFCIDAREGDKIIENAYAFGKLDQYPVTEGHTLIIPRRHFSDYFDITKNELLSLYDLLTIRKKQLTERDSRVEGFNIGVNSGKVAGQTILHCHLHLIPRRKGDLEDPRGGIRGVIPAKMKYGKDHET
jgi:ATP adenylyltransferase